MIWGTTVTPLQMFGYSIALGGLIYYKLGADKLKEHFNQAGRAWADYGVKHPALRKTIIWGAVLLTLFVVLGGLAPRYAPDYASKVYSPSSAHAGSVVGDKVAGPPPT